MPRCIFHDKGTQCPRLDAESHDFWFEGEAAGRFSAEETLHVCEQHRHDVLMLARSLGAHYYGAPGRESWHAFLADLGKPTGLPSGSRAPSGLDKPTRRARGQTEGKTK